MYNNDENVSIISLMAVLSGSGHQRGGRQGAVERPQANGEKMRKMHV